MLWPREADEGKICMLLNIVNGFCALSTFLLLAFFSLDIAVEYSLTTA